jgi:hypothetical protein
MTALREIIEEETAQAGVRRQRVLTLIDKLHREGGLSFEQYAAGSLLRSEIMREATPSAGVSSYGNSVGRADPTTKADRLGSRLTGFSIGYDGRVSFVGRESRGNERLLEDALFASCGCHDEAGARRVNLQHAGILIEAVLETEAMPTLAGITLRLTDFYGATSRKSPGFGRGVLSVLLSKLAQHYRLTK